MASKVPSVKLNSGYSIPIIGLGTWNVSTITTNVKKTIQNLCMYYYTIFYICTYQNYTFVLVHMFICIHASTPMCARLINLNSVIFHQFFCDVANIINNSVGVSQLLHIQINTKDMPQQANLQVLKTVLKFRYMKSHFRT